MKRSRPSRLVWLIGGVVAILVGCGEPGSTDAANIALVNGATPPDGRAIGFDTAELDEAGTRLTLTFVGGKEYNPADLCSNHYFGWADDVDGTLNAKIVDDTPVAVGRGAAPCDDVGYFRTVLVELDAPYHGVRVLDLGGWVHFLRRPDGLVDIAVPPGWTLVAETDLAQNSTGQWTSTWTNGQANGDPVSKGTIDLYQAFGGAATVTGGEEVRTVLVNGTPAKLYRRAHDGELVIVWMLGEDGLALVVNEADFPVGAAIDLADSVTAP